MVVHLKGMGLLGSLTAWQLARHQIPFTWDDNDSEVTAWKACTGACYPSAGADDSYGYTKWSQWVKERVYPHNVLEQCAYWVDGVHKSLPHGLEAPIKATVGEMRLVGHSIHVNAQSLVECTRKEFATKRTTQPRPDAVKVVSHGFTNRLHHYLWGWTRLIKLSMPTSITQHGRPSFYLRKNRFQFAYCYPQPGTEYWYAGSNLISQHVAKRLSITNKYIAWKERFIELSGGVVKVTEEGDMIHGWRPATAGGLSETEGYSSKRERLLQHRAGWVYYPALASGGFRHFPLVWRELAELLLNKTAPLVGGAK